MHLAEGVLSAPVLVGGAAAAAAGLAWGLRGLDGERLMTAAILAATFFVAALVHIPVGPTCAHLMLSGFIALLLGRAAVPAIFTALLLQSVLLQMGGLTTLGVNLSIICLPALLAAAFFRPWLFRSRRWCLAGAFSCAALAVAGSALLSALALGLSSDAFWLTARLVFLAHIPVVLLDGLVTALAVAFIVKVKPEMFAFFRKPAAGVF